MQIQNNIAAATKLNPFSMDLTLSKSRLSNRTTGGAESGTSAQDKGNTTTETQKPAASSASGLDVMA